MIGAIKAVSDSFSTNYFLQDSAIAPFVNAGGLFAQKFPGAVLFLKQELYFGRVYYAAADSSCLAAALRQLSVPDNSELVADVIGRADVVQPCVEQFCSAGFSRYAGLLRMQRINSGVSDAKKIDASIEVALGSDIDAVHDAIIENFDTYVDQIPPLEEIKQAISLGTILIVRDAGVIAAFLYYNRSRLASTCRYLFVHPNYRRHGFYDKLMRRYFYECGNCVRLSLWVNETNHIATSVYRWYGYKTDLTVDSIVIKRN
jgi:GNAT superfamily N-acetyltransferase